MTELDELIAKAFASDGKQDDANKLYLALIRTLLFMPVEKISAPIAPEGEPFKPLFAHLDGNYFLLAFDAVERLQLWAGEQMDLIDYVEISGRDLIAGLGEQVYLVLNLGEKFSKEFSPDEIKRLKTVVARIDQLRQT